MNFVLIVSKLRNFILQTRNCALKTRNCVLKTKKFVFKMMNCVAAFKPHGQAQ